MIHDKTSIISLMHNFQALDPWKFLFSQVPGYLLKGELVRDRIQAPLIYGLDYCRGSIPWSVNVKYTA